MIYITGYGVISALGNGVAENFQGLLEEKTAIAQGKKDFSKPFLVAEVKESNEALKANLNITSDYSRTALLGITAAKEAFDGHDRSKYIKTGLISGTSVGGMDLSENEYKKFLQSDASEQVSKYAQHSSGLGAFQIAKLLGITDFVNTVTTACSSAANALMMGARMIELGLIDRAVVGASDGLSLFTISGFNSLMIFDKDWCSPFDANRKGLNLGEGAGFLVIESEKCQKQTGSKILGILSGWGNASDAFHQTASSPEGLGAILAMEKALKKANLKPSDIDYINAHGTATPNNDLSESVALKSVFEKVPPFSSTKSYTGHTLAASGGIEAVFALLALEHQLLLPNLNFKTAIHETGLIPVQKIQKTEGLKHILSNSFGFGGNNSSIIISKI